MEGKGREKELKGKERGEMEGKGERRKREREMQEKERDGRKREGERGGRDRSKRESKGAGKGSPPVGLIHSCGAKIEAFLFTSSHGRG